MRRQNSPQKPFKFPIHYVWVHVVILNYAFCLNRFIFVVCYFSARSITRFIREGYVYKSTPCHFCLNCCVGYMVRYINTISLLLSIHLTVEPRWVDHGSVWGIYFFYWIAFITTWNAGRCSLSPVSIRPIMSIWGVYTVFTMLLIPMYVI
jgi:predicted transporter